MAGVKGRSGPQKKLGAQIDEAIKRIDNNLPDLISKIIELALNGDRESLIYLVNRLMGAPRISVDSRVKQQIELSAENILEIRQLAERENKTFLTEPLQLETSQDNESEPK